MRRESVKRHYIMFPLFITLLISAIYVTGLPLGLIQYEVAGNNIFYMFNVILATVLCFILIKILYPEWRFGFQPDDCIRNALKYGWTGLVGTVLILISSYYVYSPFDKIPAKGTIVVWVVIYNFLVAFIEELFLRGVLLNTLIKGFNNNKHGIIIAVLVSSILFGLGHIPGMLQYKAELVVMKLAWTFGLGIFLGSVYICSGNLWTVIIFHWLFNMAGGTFYYYSSSGDVFANALGFLIVCSVLAVVGIVYIVKKSHSIKSI